MKCAIVSFSRYGLQINKKIIKFCIASEMEYTAHTVEKYSDDQVSSFEIGAADWIKEIFKQVEAIIFIGAMGIAVRLIAPYIANKNDDPAVIVIDDEARFVVPVLSGHIGGANQLALQMAQYLDSVPIITTSSDIHDVFAVDTWAMHHNLVIVDSKMIKEITSRILDGESVGIHSEFPLIGALPKGLVQGFQYEAGVLISIHTLAQKMQCYPLTLQLVPRIVTVGVGCRKGTTKEAIERFYKKVLSEYHISENAIEQIASIDLKINESGLKEFSKQYNLPFLTYSSEELSIVKGNFSDSEFVSSITGIGNVCERAAVKASENGLLLIRKTSDNGITIAAAIRAWRMTF